jgi:Domain of unknown function (DUF4062)
MDSKRYQVFVSSTFLDLREERHQVILALLELGCMPAGMELFPASDESQWELIKRVIDDCDYYIVVLGGRYGSVDSAGVSYTEREYDYAVNLKLPVLGFVHSNPTAIPVGKSELDAKARSRLDEFRTKVQARMCKSWSTPEELGGAVSRSLVQTIGRTPREGWVKARHAASAEVVNDLRGQVEALQQQLAEVRITPPVSAEGLAKGSEPFTIHYSSLIDSQSLRLTWDDIIATVGPSMFHEASEDQVRNQLARRIIDKEGRSRHESIRLKEEDFQTIKVQLLALGIIQKSVKKRAVSDTTTYWSLTPFGEHYTMTLKAIRSAEHSGTG